MSKDTSKKEFLFDNRISQRHLRQGLLERQEFEQYLASLPDLIDACEDIGEEIYGNERTSAALSAHYYHAENEDEDN